jgi:PAS domain-containing protein
LSIPTPAEVVAERVERGRDRHSIRQRHRPNGQVVRFENHPLADGGFVVEVSDITALKSAEDEAKRRAALLDGVLEALPHGVVVFGADRRAALANPAYRAIMGEAGARIGETPEELVARRLAAGEFDEAAAERALRRFAMIRPAPQRSCPRSSACGRTAPRSTCAWPGCRMAASSPSSPTSPRSTRPRSRRAARAELLDAVLEALPDGVVVYGPDQRARMTNAAYRRIMGDAAVRPGESLRELGERRIAAGEFSRETMEALLRRHIAPDAEVGRPIRRVRPDGTALVTRAGRLPDGGYISVVSDVTALHRAEEELSRRAAILEASFAAMRHGIVIFGPDRRLLACNARIGVLCGIPQSCFVIGRSFDELIGEQVARGVITEESGRVALARDRSGPHRLIRDNGDRLIIEILSDPTPDGGFVLTYTDVTALHHAEEDAARRAAVLEAMLANIHHGIILYGPDRRVVACNAKTTELCGMAPGTLPPGRLMDEILDEQLRQGQIAPAVVEQLKTADRSKPFRYTRTRPDGRVIDVTPEPTPDGSFVITFSDVTEERRIRAELEAAKAAAEAGSAAKSRFLATMSHELRTPLNAVIGFSEAIAMERDRKRVEEYAGAINEAGRQLLLLIDDILDVARSQTGALSLAEEPVALAPVLQAAVRDAAEAATAAGLALELSCRGTCRRCGPIRGGSRRSSASSSPTR